MHDHGIRYCGCIYNDMYDMVGMMKCVLINEVEEVMAER